MTHETPIRLTTGRQPRPTDPEFREMQGYESGRAEQQAALIPGPHEEPWLNVLAFHEPGAQPSLQQALATPFIAQRMRGTVADLGAGTCWATAEISKLDVVHEVVAVDLSEGFLRRVGTRMIHQLHGNVAKVRFVAGSYEDVPEPDGTFDAALLIASIHHAIAPLKVLLETRRLLKTGGLLLMIENPCSTLGIEAQRRRCLELTRSTEATEIAYTRGELDYLLRHAGFVDIEWRPANGFSANPLKRAVRRALRWLDLEHHLLSVSYIVTAISTT
ncbi:MAG TPA: class I SAM-dependent methyltransferase [Thermoanaerobaculia bacterium]